MMLHCNMVIMVDRNMIIMVLSLRQLLQNVVSSYNYRYGFISNMKKNI